MTSLSKTERNMRDYGVSWFKFDEASGNVTDSKGTAIGTINGGVTRVAGWNGQGNALSFNGTGSSYVQFNQKVIPLGKKSIRFGLKLNVSSRTDEAMIVMSNVATTASYGFQFWFEKNGFLNIAKAYGSSGNWDGRLIGTIDFNDLKWHDILFTWDGTTNENSVKLYIDDLKTPNVTGKITISETDYSYNLILGRQNLTTANLRFNGQIDNLEIYNEVIYLHDKKIVLSQDNLVFSMQNNKIIQLDNSSELSFVDYGIDGNTKIIGANIIYNEIENISTQSQTFENGKTFTHSIDLDKFRGKKVKL